MFLTNVKKFIKKEKEGIKLFLLFAIFLIVLFLSFNRIVYILNYDEIKYRDNLIVQRIDKITLAGTNKLLINEKLRDFGGYSGNRFVVFRESEMIKTSLTPLQVLDWYAKQLLAEGWQGSSDYKEFLQYAKDHNEEKQNDYITEKLVKVSFYKDQHLFIIWLANRHLYYELRSNVRCIYQIKITQTDDFQMPTPEHLK